MIFENENKLLGEQEYSSADYSLIPLLREAASIRKKLGRKGYLLDAYLSAFLEAVMPLSDYEACEEGFSDATEFRDLCRKAVGQRPTDPVVREVYDENSWISSFQESSTRTELLQALCLDRKLSVFVCLTCLGYQAGSIISYHKKNSSTGFPDRRVLVILIKCRKYG